MSITVKFFASLKEQFSEPTMVIDLPSDNTTVEQVWRQVSQTTSMPSNVLSAINKEYAQAEDFVKENDEVAFFPPVTGG